MAFDQDGQNRLVSANIRLFVVFFPKMNLKFQKVSSAVSVNYQLHNIIDAHQYIIHIQQFFSPTDKF